MAAPLKSYRVELYVEVPADTVASPELWDWNHLVNKDSPPNKQTPVMHVVSTELTEGNA